MQTSTGTTIILFYLLTYLLTWPHGTTQYVQVFTIHGFSPAAEQLPKKAKMASNNVGKTTSLLQYLGTTQYKCSSIV